MASFVLPIISGIAGLFGGGKQQQTQGDFSGSQKSSSSGSSSGTSSGTSTSTSTPNLSPIQQQMLQLFSSGLSKQLGDTDLTGYTQQGLENISQTGRGARAGIAANLARRGLSYSPAAANPSIQESLNESGQQNQFLAGVPLLQRQLRSNALDQLIKGFSAIPTGSTQTGSFQGDTSQQMQQSSDSSSQGHQTGTVSGNPWAGLVSGFGAGLAAPSSGGGSNFDNLLKAFGYGKSNGDPNNQGGG